MPTYKVKFQIYGKRMQTAVDAPTEEAAKKIVASKLQFDAVERIPPQSVNDLVDPLNDLLRKMGIDTNK